MQHCSTAFSIIRTRNCERAPLALQGEFAAAHEKLALWVGTYEAAFVVEKLRPTDRAELPPVFLFFLLGRRGIRAAHQFFVYVRWRRRRTQTFTAKRR